MEYTIEQLDEKLNRLITILCEDENIDVNMFHLQELSLGDKRVVFRGLSNKRPPIPLSSEFMRLQDEILSYETKHKNNTDVKKLDYLSNMTIFQGDITTLIVDAIVNAGNPTMLGSFEPCDSSIDNVIMSAGGLQIRQELNYLMNKQGHPEPNGKAKLTKGYNLPASYIIHTVGPIVYDKVSYHDKMDLINCYKSCLNLALESGFETIAFCCISTGRYRFPREMASKIAVRTVLDWLKENQFPLKVVFCVYNDFDRKLYEEAFDEYNIK